MAKKLDVAIQLVQKGYRVTPQRMMILEALEAASGHISAEEIFGMVCRSYPGLNISTVYRTLELLKEIGVITETDMGDGRVRFHCSGHEHHHHLVCTVCGKVIDLQEEILKPLAKTICDRYSFQAELNHLAIFGSCQNCCPNR